MNVGHVLNLVADHEIPDLRRCAALSLEKRLLCEVYLIIESMFFQFFLIIQSEGIEFPSVIEKVGGAFFSQKEIFLEAEERTVEEFFFLLEEFENLKDNSDLALL